MKSIQTGGYKLIAKFDPAGADLFDLRTDPGESMSVTAQSPVLARQLLQQLISWLAENRRLATEFESASENQREVIVDEEVLKRLRALGYVD